MSQEQARDTRAVVPPNVKTGIQLIGKVTTDELKIYLPGVTAGLLGVLVLLFIHTPVGISFLVMGGALIGGAAHIQNQTPAHKSPQDLLITRFATRKLKKKLPLSKEEMKAEIPHGVTELRADGIARTENNDLISLVEVSSSNIQTKEQTERLEFAQLVTGAIDKEISDLEFRIFVTSEKLETEKVTQRFEGLAESDLRNLDEDLEKAAYMQEQCEDFVEWFENVDEPELGTFEEKFYVAVISGTDGVELTNDDSRWSRLLDIAIPGRNLDLDVDEGHLKDKLEKNTRTVMRAFSALPHSECRVLDAEEAANVYSRCFTGKELEGTEHLKKFARENRTIEDVLAPDVFNVDGDTVTAGSSKTTTLWVSKWPEKPDPMFMKDIFDKADDTIRNINTDICIRCRPEDPLEKPDDISRKVASIQVEAEEAFEEEGEIEASDLKSDRDLWRWYREVVASDNSRPWEVSMYITVRATPERGMQYAHENYQNFNNLDVAQEAALEKDVKRIRKFLEQRCGIETIRPSKEAEQQRAFFSGTPVSPDYYHTEAESSKTVSMPGAVLGSIGLFTNYSTFSDQGFYLGRSLQNKMPMKVNLQSGEQPPHGLVTGVTGSGKTFAVSKWLIDWYVEGRDPNVPDHSVFVCDTKAGFTSFINQLNGEHLVVDGRQTINPFEIVPIPEEMRDSIGDDLDPFGVKIEEVVSVFSAILYEQGVDAGEYLSIIDDAVRQTYLDAGIKPDDLDSHARPSPTPEDFLTKIEEMAHSVEEYTMIDHEYEGEELKQLIGELATKLRGLQEHGKYAHMLGDKESPITQEDVDSIYIDLRQLEGSSDAEKSVSLSLILGQISQKIKRTEGETVFAIDEAHILLNNPKMVEWLAKAVREWREYNATLLFVTQDPADFSPEGGEGGGDTDKHRHTILEQCGFIGMFRNSKVNIPTLKRGYDMNDTEANFVKKDAVQGTAGLGYSTFIANVTDKGWMPIRVEAPEYTETVLKYSDRKHGDFYNYINKEWRNPPREKVASIHGQAVPPQEKTNEVENIPADQAIGHIAEEKKQQGDQKRAARTDGDGASQSTSDRRGNRSSER